MLIGFFLLTAGQWGSSDAGGGLPMGGMLINSGLMVLLLCFGLLCGGIVVLGALKLRAPGQKVTFWRRTIIIFSALSLLAMGGFILGAVLGMVGGFLAKE
jgi:hypothetical protein